MRWAALLFLCSCANPLLNLRATKLVDQRYELHSTNLESPDSQAVQHALDLATPALERWKGIPSKVIVYVVPTHDDLEVAVSRRGFSWLKAWSRFDDVIIQAPSTWRADPAVLDRLVLHELTHCLLFQRSGTAQNWVKKDIPLWFREGMAIHTAQQQREYPGLEDIAKWLDGNPELDVFANADRLSVSQSGLVYGFSLYAFAFLVQRFGDAKVLELMRVMQEGKTFAEAFTPVLATSQSGFEADFLAYLKFRGFRVNGRTVPMRLQKIDPRPDGH